MPTRHIFGQDQQFINNPNIINQLRGYGNAGVQVTQMISRYLAPNDLRRQRIIRRNIHMGVMANGLSLVNLSYDVISNTLGWVKNAITYTVAKRTEHEDEIPARIFAEETGTFINLL
jgi:hypothetical protein